jgi:hypothetical protein
MLFENINIYVCDFPEEIYVPYVGESIPSTWINVNMLRDNILFYIGRMALMMAWSKII